MNKLGILAVDPAGAQIESKPHKRSYCQGQARFAYGLRPPWTALTYCADKETSNFFRKKLSLQLLYENEYDFEKTVYSD